MILYFNVKSSSQLDPHVIFISVIKYIFIIAGLKFIEKRYEMVGFFNIYIGLILIVDIGFTCYNYMKNTFFIPVTTQNKNIDFNKQFDDIIDTNFDFKNFNKELDSFDKQINSMIKKKSIKIIKKNNTISEDDIKEFNKNVASKQNSTLQEEKVNQEKVNQEKLNQEKVNQEKVNQEKVNQEKVNQEKVNQEKVNQEKVNQEKVNQEKVNQEKVNQEKVNQEKVNQEKVNQEYSQEVNTVQLTQNN